jgi:sugar/nucleoside kinase (ribokinase family)
MTFDLLVAGHPSIDLIFSGLPQWPELGHDIDAESLGVCAGTSFNTPAAANRLGLRVGYIGMIGNDVWSRMVREEFEAEDMPTDFLRVVERPMGFVSVAFNLDHDRGFVSYESATEGDDEELGRHALDVVARADARHLHGYAGEEPSQLTAIARERGMSVSLDAWGGPWWDLTDPLHEVLSLADVVFANEAESLAMTGEPDVGRAAERLSALTPCVVIKRGAQGAMARTGGEWFESPAEPAHVVDTTGAGDCFNAGFLFGWLAGLPVADSLTLANICGARAVEAFGGYRGCPRGDELRRLASARGIALPDDVGPDRTVSSP